MKKIVLLASVLIAGGVTLTVNMREALADNHTAQEVPTQTSAADLAQDQPTTADEFFLDLNLTDAQQQRILEIFEGYQPAIDAIESDFDAEAARLGDVVQPTASESDIRVYRTTLLQLSETYNALIFERNMAIRNVLDVEQRTKINELLRAILEKM